MYYKLEEDNRFTGFYEEVQEGGTFVEISIEDWQSVLDKQSEGEVIFYNPKSKKLETILLGQFETLKGTSIETDILALKKSIISELAELKYEYAEKEFIFQEKYLQKNRDVDKSNLTSVVVMLNATKQTEFKNWKFKDLNNVDVYVNITIADMLNMANTMQNQTTKALITESTLIAKLETLTVEELKTFDAYKEFENLWNK